MKIGITSIESGGVATTTSPSVPLVTMPPDPVPPANTPFLNLQLARPMTKPTWMGTFNGNMSAIDDFCSATSAIIETTQRKFSDLNDGVAEMSADLGNLGHNVSELKNQVRVIDNKVDNNNSTIESVANDIYGTTPDTINGRVTTVETRLGYLESRVDTIEGDQTYLELSTKITQLQNEISALNTKVDNAITGGTLKPTYKFNMKSSTYTDSGSDHVYDISGDANQFGGTFPASGTAYLTRVYTIPIAIQSDYLITANIAAATGGTGSTLNYVALRIKGSSGRWVELSRNANNVVMNAISLAAYSGQTVTFSIEVSGFAGYKTCTINTLIIHNKAL